MRERQAIALAEPDVLMMSSEPAVVKQRPVEKAGPQTAGQTQRPQAATDWMPESRVATVQPMRPQIAPALSLKLQAATAQLLNLGIAEVRMLRPQIAAARSLTLQAAEVRSLKPQFAAAQPMRPQVGEMRLLNPRAAKAQANGELMEWPVPQQVRTLRRIQSEAVTPPTSPIHGQSAL